jgi:hypothetical protein
MFNTKKRKLKKLQTYLTLIYADVFPAGYLEENQHRIACLEWLVAYYKGRAASTPQDLFEILIGTLNPTLEDCHWATTLWYWIHKDEIYGF